MSKFTRKDFLGLGALVAGSLGARALDALEPRMGSGPLNELGLCCGACRVRTH